MAVVVSLSALLQSGCSEFPTRFEQVGDDKVRVLDFIYRNRADTTLSEAAPGDSMDLIAVFAGAPVRSIEWRVSFDVSIKGGGLVPDFGDHGVCGSVQPLRFRELAGGDTAVYGTGACAKTIRFCVPADVMKESPAIPEDIFEEAGISREDGFMMLDSLLKKPVSRWLSLLARSADSLDTLGNLAAAAAQRLTISARIIAVVNGVYEIHSDFTVRYNRLVGAYFTSVKVNRNPVARWAGVYKVKGADKAVFRPSEAGDRDTFFCFFAQDRSGMPASAVYSDTLAVQEGFSYFLAVDSGVFKGADLRDSGTTLDEGGGRTCAPETWFTQWFLKPEGDGAAAAAPEDLPAVLSTRILNRALGAPADPFIPPADRRITSMDLWVQVFDSYLGERLRPYGSTLTAMKLYLKYE
jgi:hypothetical protein